MSKVFNAKRKTAEFEYEFLDGNKQTLVARSLSSKEQVEVTNAAKEALDNDAFLNNFRDSIRKQLASNDREIVEKILVEQYESGDLIEFGNALAGLIREEKAKK
jgi:hypothetical protein